jgi:hypothetical protein
VNRSAGRTIAARFRLADRDDVVTLPPNCKGKGLLEEGYIRGVAEDRPAVIQLNSLIANLAVNELLARLHPIAWIPMATTPSTVSA